MKLSSGLECELMHGQGQEWEQAEGEIISPQEIRARYEAGHAGAVWQPAEREQLARDVYDREGRFDGADNAMAWGLAGKSEERLCIPWIYAADAFGGLFLPGPAQGRGDCVSHSTRTAAAVTLGCELYLQRPDHASGQIEGFPVLEAAAIQSCVLSSEALYWWRRHGGEGWSVEAACRVVMSESGMWLRRNYTDLGIDLTTYSSVLAGKWGRQTPPDKIKQVGQGHLIRSATNCESWEPAADYLASGYGLTSSGMQAWSDRRDAYGYSPTVRGSWAHAEAIIGCDRRTWVRQVYGTEALFLMQNSWGRWNSGSREIRDSAYLVPPAKRQRWQSLGMVAASGNILIPEGSRWIDAREVSRRSVLALSGAAGWPPRDLAALTLRVG